ncbi:unnamed protein product [[Candida] boidinii]|uniref:Unnamed protein product n=1 Tax=Candida boidinii TaxID=5477 RepID=A0ACB5TPE4_CANBO|nr:unnamed protein product [[Candida] boidinii]
MSEYIPKLRRPLRNSSRYNSDSSNIGGNSNRYNISSRVSESDSKKRLRFIDDNNITSTQSEIEKDRRKNSAAEFLKSKENTSYLSNNINNYSNMSRSNSSSSSSRINRYTPQLSDITSSNERTSINNISRSRINELSDNINNNKYDSLNTAPIRRLNNNNLPINSKRILRNDTNRIRQLNNSRINKPSINSNRNNNNSSLSRSILSSLSNAGSKLFKSLLVNEPTNDNTQTSTGLGYTRHKRINYR